jgi:hypothetical protein
MNRSSEAANREAGQTQQRQVTETITRDMPKLIATIMLRFKTYNGQTQEMNTKKSRKPNRFRTMGYRTNNHFTY